ncbi:hypothetical protein ACFQWH_13090 [Mycolicibacterium sp. GCM10028919]|jgi:hypothetical protein|uniref:hypothetical protein n=1 Tax=Mycolicibacterium sp. GCM10028919 TaxID=3273401 RepID=UPI00360FF87A|nr:hypothetical protein [Mycobacterium sp.]
MNPVVERGVARCPSCVAIADYCFTEDGPDSVRYEVRCRKCGEVYRETSVLGATALTVDTMHYVYIPASEVIRVAPTDRVLAEAKRWCSAAAITTASAAAGARVAAATAVTAVAATKSALAARARAVEMPTSWPKPRELEAGGAVAG